MLLPILYDTATKVYSVLVVIAGAVTLLEAATKADIMEKLVSLRRETMER